MDRQPEIPPPQPPPQARRSSADERAELLQWLASYGVELCRGGTGAVRSERFRDRYGRERSCFVGRAPRGVYTLTISSNIGASCYTYLTRERLLAQLVTPLESAIVESAISRSAKRRTWGERVMRRLRAA